MGELPGVEVEGKPEVLLWASPAVFVIMSNGEQIQDALALAAVIPFARVANWAEIGDGTISGASWRRAWDEMIPPGKLVTAAAAAGTPLQAAALSIREADILALVCSGLSNAEIGETLVIAPSTAKRHVANIFAKLGVGMNLQVDIRTQSDTAEVEPTGMAGASVYSRDLALPSFVAM